MPSVSELLILMAAIVGSSSMVGFLGWMLYRVKRLESTSGKNKAEVERLIEQVDALQEEVTAAGEQAGELQERVDFAERLLARGKSDAANNH